MQNTERIINFIERVRDPDQLLIFLISGGGSALLPAPIEGLTLTDKLRTQQLLASSGADIRQLNIVRQALSRVKGGRLAQMCHPSPVIALIQSDIVGDPLELIASGPTVIANSSGNNRAEQERKAIDVIRLFDLEEKIPTKVLELLTAGQNETIVAENRRPPDVNNLLVANNRLFLGKIAEYFE